MSQLRKCDKCGALSPEFRPEEDFGAPKVGDGWALISIHVAKSTGHHMIGVVTNLDLCPECAGGVFEATGAKEKILRDPMVHMMGMPIVGGPEFDGPGDLMSGDAHVPHARPLHHHPFLRGAPHLRPVPSPEEVK